MNKTQSTISFNAIILIYFSKKDFDIMTFFLKNGYSEMQRHVELGGFWYGYTNTRKFLDSNKSDYDTDDYTVSLTFRQVDILLKALEPRCWINKYEKQADKLAALLSSSLHAANEQTKLAQEQFKKTLVIK